MWCLLRPGSFSADTSTPGNFDFEFYQNKLSLTHGSFLVKRELITVFLINRSIWKVVGTVKCFTIYSCSFKFSSEWVRDSEGRGEWVVMAVSAARPGCVLTCVINSLSHGYKLCYINQVKTTGYNLAPTDYLAHVPCLVPEECFHQIFIFVFHLSPTDTSSPVNKH